MSNCRQTANWQNIPLIVVDKAISYYKACNMNGRYKGAQSHLLWDSALESSKICHLLLSQTYFERRGVKFESDILSRLNPLHEIHSHLFRIKIFFILPWVKNVWKALTHLTTEKLRFLCFMQRYSVKMGGIRLQLCLASHIIKL